MTVDTKNLRERVRNAELRGPQYRPWVSAEELTELLDALERKDNLLREQLTICKYLSRSICMTDETGADTNPDTARLDWLLAMFGSDEKTLAMGCCIALGMTGREAIDTAAKTHPL